MSHLWLKDDSEEWAVFPLLSQTLSLPDALAMAGASTVAAPHSQATLLPSAAGPGAQWVLLAHSQAVILNGVPLLTGVRVLLDRDEIRLGPACSVFFSSEELATAVGFPGSEKPVFCPRCKLEIAPGTQSVKCPHCGVWHHQSDDLPCWTYAQHCTLCDQNTELGGGFRWSPDEL